MYKLYSQARNECNTTKCDGTSHWQFQTRFFYPSSCAISFLGFPQRLEIFIDIFCLPHSQRSWVGELTRHIDRLFF